MDVERNLYKFLAIFSLIMLLFVALLWLYWNLVTQLRVVDFASCVSQGGVVLRDKPEECVHQGESFVDNVFTTQAQESQDIHKERIIMVVEPDMQLCNSSSSTRCMVINGKVFDQPIEDFKYREGNYYKLVVVRQAKDEIEKPESLQDYTYALESIASLTYMFTPEPVVLVEEEPEAIVEEELPFVPSLQSFTYDIGPFLVDCVSNEKGVCLLVNEQVVPYSINGYTHQTGVGVSARVSRLQHYPVDAVAAGEELYTYELVEILTTTPLITLEEDGEATTTEEELPEEQ